jgi:hypothetical protein
MNTWWISLKMWDQSKCETKWTLLHHSLVSPWQAEPINNTILWQSMKLPLDGTAVIGRRKPILFGVQLCWSKCTDQTSYWVLMPFFHSSLLSYCYYQNASKPCTSTILTYMKLSTWNDLLNVLVFYRIHIQRQSKMTQWGFFPFFSWNRTHF